MQQNENNTNPIVEEEGFDFAKILSYAIAYWKLIVVSVIVCVVAAFFYLRIAVLIKIETHSYRIQKFHQRINRNTTRRIYAI